MYEIDRFILETNRRIGSLGRFGEKNNKIRSTFETIQYGVSSLLAKDLRQSVSVELSSSQPNPPNNA